MRQFTHDKRAQRGYDKVEIKDFDIKEILANYKADMKRLRILQSKLSDLTDVDRISSTTATWDSLPNGQGAMDSKADRYLIAKEEIEAEIEAIKQRNRRLEIAINELGAYQGQMPQLLINCLYRDGMSAQKTRERMSIYDSDAIRKLKRQTLDMLGAIYNSDYLGII